MKKLRRKQQQFMNLVSGGYDFKVYCGGEKGFCVHTIPDYNHTLYATITMRSLIRKGLIDVSLSGISLTNKGIFYQKVMSDD